MKRILLAASAALFLSACAQGETEPQEVVVVDPATVAPVEEVTEAVDVENVEGLSLSFTDGYILSPLKGRDVTAGYFIVQNNGAAVRMVSASSPIASEVELHTHTMTDGVMQMREVEGIDVAEGEIVTLKPGGLHLMLFGFEQAEGQTEAPVTITFDSGETRTITLPIRARE